MPKSLLIVESPTKAKTLQKYLGKEFDVRSSKGHVRDLPKNELGVDVDQEFRPKYVTIVGKNKVISDLKKAAQGVEDIYLGPDPDREGEAIAWHIAESLGEKNHRFHRVLLLELTQKAIKEALAHPVPLDRARFESQQARRILDRLVGYQLSPLLWLKVKTGLSAGRVQSVALRLLVDREKAVRAFVPEEYWTLDACLEAADPPRFAAHLVKHRGKNLKPGTVVQVERILEDLEDAPFRVAKVEKKPQKRSPSPPFITSSLQMEANRRLRFSPQITMRLAQRLYEGLDLGDEGPVGLITYMRTDSTRVSNDSLDAVRQFIGAAYGSAYVPKAPQRYKSPKGAQEAHEAIRPTDVSRRPQDVRRFLKKDEYALYELIWRRFVASQMAAATYDLTTVDVAAGDYLFRATASVMTFPGFTALYQETVEEEDKEEKLPPLKQGESLELVDFDPQQHFTKPPPRYTEASLIKELEVQGIGRPSTYATILSVLQHRDYVLKIRTRLRPTEMGMAVSDLLVANFPDVMDPKFTAHMEEDLDRIADGQVPWVDIMREFYGPFAQELAKAKVEMNKVKSVPSGISCPKCGAELLVRWGRNGEFLGCSAYPECDYTSNFSHDSLGHIVIDKSDEAGQVAGRQPVESTGVYCPNCQKELVIRRTRRGKKKEFLGCSGYPKCKFAQNFTRDEQGKIIPIEKKDILAKKVKVEVMMDYPCPKVGCGGHLLRSGETKKIVYQCYNHPKCQFILKQKPIPQECPHCTFPWLMKKGKKILCPREECEYQEAATTEKTPSK